MPLCSLSGCCRLLSRTKSSSADGKAMQCFELTRGAHRGAVSSQVATKCLCVLLTDANHFNLFPNVVTSTPVRSCAFGQLMLSERADAQQCVHVLRLLCAVR